MAARDLDPALLTTFLAVLESGRISAAARVLHLSQPAVTAQIRRLEEALETALFVRSVRGVTPTDAGMRLADHARAMRRLLEHAMTDVARAEPRSGPLVIAASTTIAAHVVPRLLAAFRAQHPHVPIRVRVGNTEQVIEDLRAERAPLGLVEGHARASGIRFEPFIDDEIVPVLGRGAPFTVRRLRDLDDVPLLWREAGSGTRAVIERALAGAGLRRRAARGRDIEMGSTDGILGGVTAGLGVAFVSRWSAQAHLSAGLLRVIPGLDLVVRRTFQWALPAGALSGPAAAFFAVARRTPVEAAARG
jgi:DNA-binding transcriptional LysR family regulator